MTQPTTVFRARKIITLNRAQPEATHVAVRDGRVLCVGDAATHARMGPLRARRALCRPRADARLGRGPLPPQGRQRLGVALSAAGSTAAIPTGSIWPGLRSMAAVVSRLREVDARMRAAGQGDAVPLIAWGFDPIYFGGERMTVRAPGARGQRAADRDAARQRPPDERQHRDAAAGRDRRRDRGRRRDEVRPTASPTASCRSRRRCSWCCAESATPACSRRWTTPAWRALRRSAACTGVTTATDLVDKLGADDIAVLERACHRDDYNVRILPAFQAFHGTHGAAQGAEHVRELMKRNSERLRYGLREDDARRLDPGLFRPAALAGLLQRRAQRHLGHRAVAVRGAISRPTTAPGC